MDKANGISQMFDMLQLVRHQKDAIFPAFFHLPLTDGATIMARPHQMLGLSNCGFKLRNS
jgi:hypothetical protein